MEYSPTIAYYLSRFRQYLGLILVVSILGGLLAYAIASRTGRQYQVHFSYVVSLREREDSNEFRFDGFYALQATDLFSQTVAEWISTPEIVVAAYKEAGLPLPGTDPHAVSRIIEAKKTAPQLVEITVKEKTADRAHKLTEGLKVVMNKNIEMYDTQGIPALQFRIVPTEPWTGSSELSAPLIGSATFLFLLFVGINLVLLLISFEGSQKESSS